MFYGFGSEWWIVVFINFSIFLNVGYIMYMYVVKMLLYKCIELDLG